MPTPGATPTPRRSRKTTTLGLMGAVGVLLVAASRLFNGDPSTSVDIAGAIDALGAILAFAGIAGAGLFARDDDVTSEDSGAAGAREVRKIVSDVLREHRANPMLSLLRFELKRQGFDADELINKARGNGAATGGLTYPPESKPLDDQGRAAPNAPAPEVGP